jgi:hypothetical protein
MMRGGTCFCDFVAVLSASSALLMGSSASTTPSPCGFSPCPSWEPTWNITQSTIIMPCNYSGYFDYTIAGRFAVVDYDWSNAKEMCACAWSLRAATCVKGAVLQSGLVRVQTGGQTHNAGQVGGWRRTERWIARSDCSSRRG